MKRFLINTLKVIMLPVIVYLIFLVICFERFSNWNCIYTIFIQTIIPTITAYAIAYGNICGVFDFTIGSRLVISGVIGGLLCGPVWVCRNDPLSAIIQCHCCRYYYRCFELVVKNSVTWVLTMGLAMVFENHWFKTCRTLRICTN